MDCHPSNNEDNEMTIASGLLQQHIETRSSTTMRDGKR
jgi:hypothetical protein